MLLQVEGDRGKDVRLRGPDVLRPVAVEILRVFKVAGRQELRLPERTRPGPFQSLERNVAAVDDLQCVEEFITKHRSAARVVCQGYERGDGRPDAGEATKVRFEAPDRDNDLRRYAVLGLNLPQHVAILRVHLLREADGLRREPPFEVRLEIEREFRLCPIPLEDLFDRLQPGERALDEFRRDATLDRFRLQRDQPLIEGRRRDNRRHRRRRLRAHSRARHEQYEQKQSLGESHGRF